MPLLPRQVAAIEVLSWLLSDEPEVFATGRTEVLCHAFIQKAIREGRAVRPFDHHMPWVHEFHSHVNFPIRLRAIMLRDYKDWDMVWNESRQSFTVHKK